MKKVMRTIIFILSRPMEGDWERCCRSRAPLIHRLYQSGVKDWIMVQDWDLIVRDNCLLAIQVGHQEQRFILPKIFLNHQDQALVLPKEAILDDGNDKIVFIKKGDKYYPQLVELGAQDNFQAEILRGLAPGEEVVTKGCFQLKSKLYDAILKKGHVH